MKNKKKLTLNQTWTLCLRMWRWIAKVWTPDGLDVDILKVQWMKDNGFEDIESGCFFCDISKYIDSCIDCPGRLVNLHFKCSNWEYSWSYKPVEFYKELLRLNKIRKAK